MSVIRPHDIIRNSTKLPEKQRARLWLDKLAARGDTEAQSILDQIAANATLDPAAAVRIAADLKRPDRRDINGPNVLSTVQQLLRATGKPDLSYVSHEELSERIQDVVMRSAVMQLLTERFVL